MYKYILTTHPTTRVSSKPYDRFYLWFYQRRQDSTNKNHRTTNDNIQSRTPTKITKNPTNDTHQSDTLAGRNHASTKKYLNGNY